MQFGKLTFEPAAARPELVAATIRARLEDGAFREGVWVAAIGPELADTAAFCAAYDIAPELGANCIIVEAKRGDQLWHAACLVLASTMIDVNGKVRRHFDARKASFAPRETALQLTGMEYGGITPLGLPEALPILIDEQVMGPEYLIVGSGIRGSKLLVRPRVLAAVAGAKVTDITKAP